MIEDVMDKQTLPCSYFTFCMTVISNSVEMGKMRVKEESIFDLGYYLQHK